MFENRTFNSLAQDKPKPDISGKNPQKEQVEKSLKPSALWTFDDQQRLRDAKRDEWRKGLLEQVQEKERKKNEEKSRRLLEDKKEEEKLNQERQQLEVKYKREIHAEHGLPYEEAPKKQNPPKPIVKEKETSPKPLVKTIEPVTLNVRNKEFNPMKLDYWKSRSDLEIQQNSFRGILDKLKQEADKAHYERNEALLELDRFREQLRMSGVDKEFRYQQRGMFARNYSSQLPLGDKFKDLELDYAVNRPLAHESRFIPLVSAGQSVVSNNSHYSMSLPRGADLELEYNDVRGQLKELDDLLTSYS